MIRDPKNLLSQTEIQTRSQFQSLTAQFPQYLFSVRSTKRTCAEQNHLYSIGRTIQVDDPPVTFARGCQSWHVLGRAIDVDISQNSKAVGCPVYTAVGQKWESMGGRWGGRFKGFGACGDAGHFEWHPGLKLSQVCPNPDECSDTVISSTPVPKRRGIGTIPLLLGLAAAGYGAWWYSRRR